MAYILKISSWNIKPIVVDGKRYKALSYPDYNYVIRNIRDYSFIEGRVKEITKNTNFKYEVTVMQVGDSKPLESYKINF